MSKSKVSKGFARFAKNTTKGSYDEARKRERVARGVPVEIGDKGTGTISFEFTERPYKKDEPDGDKYPFVKATITVLTPEGAKGKELSDPLNLSWYIKDSEKKDSDWVAEDAWASMLDDMVTLGLPTELKTGHETFDEVIDWWDAEPRIVEWEVNAELDANGNPTLYRGKPNKRVSAWAYHEEESAPRADSDEEKVSFPEGTRFVIYRGTEYGVVEETDDNKIVIKNCATGKTREVLEDSVVDA